MLEYSYFPLCSRAQERIPAHLYLTSLTALATCCRSHTVERRQEPSVLCVCPSFIASTFCVQTSWWELMLAASLTSRDLYELRTAPSSLSRADLRRGNENNEQSGPRLVWLLSNWAPLHHGTRDRQGTRGPHYQVCSPYREREREREQRAVMMMDDGAAGRLQWTGLKGSSAARGWNYLGTDRIGSRANFCRGKQKISPLVPDNPELFCTTCKLFPELPVES